MLKQGILSNLSAKLERNRLGGGGGGGVSMGHRNLLATSFIKDIYKHLQDGAWLKSICVQNIKFLNFAVSHVSSFQFCFRTSLRCYTE